MTILVSHALSRRGVARPRAHSLASRALGLGRLLLRLRVHLLELGDVAVDLLDADLARVVFVEHAEDRLVLLLVNRKLLLVSAAVSACGPGQQARRLQLQVAIARGGLVRLGDRIVGALGGGLPASRV